ncbi:uncharacterized protein LOC142818127 [Rhipicephalus microplus]|uniref:uncharacterized protein LOC142818127 n=1 Tax=Rhipicephalus microplus TaxID=6941 RepID=UPI003F6D40AC
MNFHFFVQVGDKHSVCSIRDDSLTLVVLPGPQSLLSSFCDCFLVIRLLLLTSGDVELNPGPRSDSESGSEATLNSQLLKKILKEQTKTNKVLTALSENLKHVETTVSNVQERLTAMEKELARLQQFEDKLAEHKVMTVETNKLVRELSVKVEDLKNRSRRNNIIIYGVEEGDNEQNADLQQRIVKGIFKDILKVNVTSVERMHRIGRKTQNRERPVILKLYNFSEKMVVLRNCNKLKRTAISISEDFSARVRDLRKKLWQSAKKDRDNGAKVTLVFDKLKIDDDLYVWDEAKNARVSMRRARHDGRANSNA